MGLFFHRKTRLSKEEIKYYTKFVLGDNSRSTLTFLRAVRSGEPLDFMQFNILLISFTRKMLYELGFLELKRKRFWSFEYHYCLSDTGEKLYNKLAIEAMLDD